MEHVIVGVKIKSSQNPSSSIRLCQKVDMGMGHVVMGDNG